MCANISSSVLFFLGTAKRWLPPRSLMASELSLLYTITTYWSVAACKWMPPFFWDLPGVSATTDAGLLAAAFLDSAFLDAAAGLLKFLLDIFWCESKKLFGISVACSLSEPSNAATANPVAPVLIWATCLVPSVCNLIKAMSLSNWENVVPVALFSIACSLDAMGTTSSIMFSSDSAPSPSNEWWISKDVLVKFWNWLCSLRLFHWKNSFGRGRGTLIAWRRFGRRWSKGRRAGTCGESNFSKHICSIQSLDDPIYCRVQLLP